MKIIGLTGSIGMGKSVTAALIRSLGTPVFDSDSCVHALLAGRAIPHIRATFPSVWDVQRRAIDRQVLGKIVFQDMAAKAQLEAILHPMVWEEQRKFITLHRRTGAKAVVLDVPLLFETGRDRICDEVICVTAPRFLQEQRVLSRKGMTQEKFNAILEAQMPDEQKQLLADITIPTGLGKAFTLQKLKKILGSEHDA